MEISPFAALALQDHLGLDREPTQDELAEHMENIAADEECRLTTIGEKMRAAGQLEARRADVLARRQDLDLAEADLREAEEIAAETSGGLPGDQPAEEELTDEHLEPGVLLDPKL